MRLHLCWEPHAGEPLAWGAMRLGGRVAGRPCGWGALRPGAMRLGGHVPGSHVTGGLCSAWCLSSALLLWFSSAFQSSSCDLLKLFYCFLLWILKSTYESLRFLYRNPEFSSRPTFPPGSNQPELNWGGLLFQNEACLSQPRPSIHGIQLGFILGFLETLWVLTFSFSIFLGIPYPGRQRPALYLLLFSCHRYDQYLWASCSKFWYHWG